MKVVICLQIPTVFRTGGKFSTGRYEMYMAFVVGVFSPRKLMRILNFKV